DAAGGGFGGHGIVGAAVEGRGELAHVADDAVDAELAGRVGIDGGQHARSLGANVLAPDLAVAEEEALLAVVAVNGGVGLVGEGGLHRHVGDAGTAAVAEILAERELAVDLDAGDGAEVVVLVDQASGAFGEGLGVGGRPPVAQVALGIELAALVVKAVGHLVADDDADRAVVAGIVALLIEERRLEDAGGEDDLVELGFVIGVDRGRGHLPLAAVHGLADLVELAAGLEGLGAAEVGVVVVAA